MGKDTQIPRYVAHVSDDKRFEPLERHLREVSQMAARFAKPLGMEELASVTGLVHDLGKYSRGFQNRVLRGGPKVDHSTAGAFELLRRQLWLGGYCVLGHHAGLPDGGTGVETSETLAARLHKAARGEIENYDAYQGDGIRVPDSVADAVPSALRALPANWGERELAFSLGFAIRMLFSCLVDADFLCTERFMRGQEREGLHYDSLPTLSDRLERALRRFYPPSGTLNETRCSVLDACRAAAPADPGVFSLTVPTGGGKTLAVTRFALSHATYGGRGMRRVIYAVPYTSIIEQNAQVLREWLGNENVLEHHASYDVDAGNDEDRAQRLRLATEDWDAPIVVTTNVQLFESLYAARTSRCRKLHNIAGSVIVLDEAQMLPLGQLRPCVRALAELVASYGCSVVLCTATQPSLDGFFSDLGISVTEIAPRPHALFRSLERVSYEWIGEKSDEELEALVRMNDRALCIVDNRRQAHALYEGLADRGIEGLFHLSTLMYPAHRVRVLAEIRARLASGAPCRVISTSLVEAGVDVDFPVVMRSVSGIDSLIQAAGRCNREGRLGRGRVLAFSPSPEWKLPAETRQRAAVTRDVVREVLEGDFSRVGSLEAIGGYFKRLYIYRSSDGEHDMLDEKGVLSMLPKPGWTPVGSYKVPNYCFRTAAEGFRMIDDASISVIVPTTECESEVDALRGGFATKGDLRRLGRFTVGVYERDVRNLYDAGVVEQMADGLYLLTDESLYGEKTGLWLTPKTGEGMFW